MLTVTSYPHRTSPVDRGKWLLDNIWDAAAAAARQHPALPENATGRGAGDRARADGTASEQPVCANCHAPIDPLGFALENFDAIGKWRT